MTHYGNTNGAFTYRRNILNMVVVGQSGVGKSSFLNYVADKDYFQTGVGAAVTKGYFHTYETKRNNVSYALYDTEGLEPGKIDDWEKNIHSEIKRRDASTDMSDWFHSVLFCISAESKRVQPFEIEAIRRMASTGHVIVLLTKMDKVSPSVLEDMKTEIHKQIGDQIDILAVCSVAQKFRNGTESHKQGLDAVLKTTFIGLWKKMAMMVPPILLRSIISYHGTIEYYERVSSFISWNIINGIANSKNSMISMSALCQKLGLDMNSISSSTVIPISRFRAASKFDCNMWKPDDTILWKPDDTILISGDFNYRSILDLPFTPSKSILDWGLFRAGLHSAIIKYASFRTRLLSELKEFNVNSKLNSLTATINVCKRLYFDVTGETLKKEVSMHDIKKTLDGLKCLSEEDDQLTRQIDKVKSAIRDVDSCTFFSSTERDRLIEEYSQLKESVDKFRSEYAERLTAVINSIKQELRSFADYMLRHEEKHKCTLEIDKDDLSQFLRLVRATMTESDWTNLMVKMYGHSLFEDHVKRLISSI